MMKTPIDARISRRCVLPPAAVLLLWAVPLTAAGTPRDAVWPHGQAESVMTLRFPQGEAITPVGDVDGDGAEDFVLTTPQGFVLIFGGAFSPGTRTWDPQDGSSTQFMRPHAISAGCSLCIGVGDVNGDGYADFLLGPFWRTFPGEVVVRSWLLLVLGGEHLRDQVFSLDADVPNSAIILGPPEERDMFQMFCARWSDASYLACGGGDFDNDGIPDMVIGVRPRRHPLDGSIIERPGMLFVLYGRPQWPAEASIDALALQGWQVTATTADTGFPAHVAFPGDLDGDGIAEFAMTSGWGEMLGAGIPLEGHWRTTVFFGGTVAAGTALSLADAQRDHWTLERCAIGAGVGDMDGDGFHDALVRSTALVPEDVPTGGFLLYGAPREQLIALTTRAHLVPPHATRLERPSFSSDDPVALLLDPGVAALIGGHDWDGDGVPDMVMGCPIQNVYFAPTRNNKAGSAAVILGRSSRSETLEPATPYMEGFFASERLGAHPFFTRFDEQVFLAVTSYTRATHHVDEDLLLSFLPPPPWRETPLSVAHVYDASISLLLLGAGFEPGLQVFFGETASASVEVYSASVARAAVPHGPPGEEVALEVRLGDARARAPVDYTYPHAALTPIVDLAAHRGKGVTRIFTGAANQDIRGAALASDIVGDGRGNIVVQVRTMHDTEYTTEFVILSADAAREEDVDVAADDDMILARFGIAGMHHWDFDMDTADFDGDGVSDLALTTFDSLKPRAYAVVFGGPHLLEGGEITPGPHLLLVHRSDDTKHDWGFFPGDLNSDGIADLAPVWRCRRPGADLPTYDSVILLGGPHWRQEGQTDFADLFARGRAVTIVNGGQITPVGEFDGMFPGENLHLGKAWGAHGDRSTLALTSGVPTAVETAYGDLLAANAPFGSTVLLTLLSILSRGPVDLDGLGTSGLLLAAEGMPWGPDLPMDPVPGRVLALSLDAWDLLPGVLVDMTDVTAPPNRGSVLKDDLKKEWSVSVYLRPTRNRVPTPVGDVDGDGATDYLLPMVREGFGAESSRALLVYGGPHMVDGATRVITRLGALGAEFMVPGKGAHYIAGPACDLDGDGLDDMLLGFRPSDSASREFYLVLGRRERFFTSTAPPAVPFRRGDANADGTLNIADAVFTLVYMFAGGDAPPCANAADANADGKIDVADAISILAHIFGGAGPLPAPFEVCGVQPIGAPGPGCERYPPCETP